MRAAYGKIRKSDINGSPPDLSYSSGICRMEAL